MLTEAINKSDRGNLPAGPEQLAVRAIDSAVRFGRHAAVACVVGAVGLICMAGAASAVPVLQVGAPGGPGEGAYAGYGDGTNPTEDDTAFTSGGTLYVAGVYQNDNVQHLGGQFGAGNNWSTLDLPGNSDPFPTIFDSHGAILLVSVPDGTLATALGSLTVNGLFAFHSSEDQSFFPNIHDPVKDAISDFLFFDIGEFLELVAVPDFADESVGSKLGEIKTLLIAGFGDLPWVHFDAMALQTSDQGQTSVITTREFNPPSHDATWKPGDEIPEPATLALLGIGLTGLALLMRRRKPAP